MKLPPGSPSKGKLKEDSSWNAGWYDFYPAIEYPRRSVLPPSLDSLTKPELSPVEWSNSSIIFTGHGTRPVICGRYYSSSKQFVLPSPPPLQTEPDSYGPASVISVSPDDEWLFAYFPGHNVEGVCCFWKRGLELDKWTVRDWWTSPSGLVKAEWIGSGREWICDPVTQKPIRLPYRGPRIAISTATMLLVTENHQVILCYFRQNASNFKMLTCSLLKQSVTVENATKTEPSPPNELNSTRICTTAAIGLSYHESSIIVATRSQRYPLPLTVTQFNSIEVGGPTERDETQLEVLRNIPEDYEEECTIELCEVLLNFTGVQLAIGTRPLPPIQVKDARLKDLNFTARPKNNQTPQGGLYLVANFFDFQDYTSVPTTNIECYSLLRQPRPDSPIPWVITHESSRTFDAGIVGFVVPCRPVSGACNVIAGVYWRSGTQPRSLAKSKETPVGSLHILSIPNLTNDDEWESLPILKASDKPGLDGNFLFLLSAVLTEKPLLQSSLWNTQTSLQKVPQRKLQISNGPSLSAALVAAILSQRATTDITLQISHHSLSSNVIADILNQSFSVLDEHHNISARAWIQQVGACLETYRLKASRPTHEREREDADARWQAAHDICSLVACNLIFDECREGDAFNTDAVWQLVDASIWVMAFLEKTMKECILLWDTASSSRPDGNFYRNVKVYGLTRTTSVGPSTPDSNVTVSPNMLHFAHPQALQNVLDAVTNVKKFREFLGALTARSENSQIARDVLIDQIDCSGVDLGGLIPILTDLRDSIQTVDAAQARRSLALCTPIQDQLQHLKTHLPKILQSKVLDKSKIFLKPNDLLDGLPGEQPRKPQVKDVVTKSLLLKRNTTLLCLRCGGQTEGGQEDSRLPREVRTKLSLDLDCGGSGWVA
ncbi:pseudouridine synthase pus4 [Paramarasmius palmivorus]|uniref:Pseudouridine synthase pus4 n=1 Tax=Paramarasmius palmivorus TaxID=297713 RepID=A0AAW0DSX3_9AGAR